MIKKYVDVFDGEVYKTGKVKRIARIVIDNVRYVRAEVAMRYARMRERKGYNLCRDEGISAPWPEVKNISVMPYEEAQQAWIKQNRGNVAQRDGK